MSSAIEVVKNDDEAHIPKVLFVDDEAPVLKAISRFSRRNNWHVFLATSGAEGLELLSSNPDIDVVVSDMRMPGMSGSEFLLKVRNNYPDCVRILLTGYSDIQALESAINDAKIYNYLTKPWDENLLHEVVEGALRFRRSEQERQRLQQLTQKQNRQLGKLALSLDKQVKERTIEIQQALSLLQLTHDRVTTNFYEALKVLNHVFEWKEGRDSNYNRFVADYAIQLAQIMELPNDDQQDIRIASMLHRIGTLGLPDDIRNSPVASLNEEQRAEYRKSPLMGEAALAAAPGLAKVAKIIRHQHEYVNGNGFPDGLALDDVPMGSYIIGMISDFYQASNGQLDKNINGYEEAKQYLKEWAGKKYDTRLVEHFLEIFKAEPNQRMNKKVLEVSQLEEGMLLVSDVVTASGVLLLSKNSTLKTTQINLLKTHEKTYNETFNVVVSINEENT
jgi:response regulator RpfG family c-di-GMP phosphodiesterase